MNAHAEREQPTLVAIIDDEQDITTYLGLALEDAGFAVAITNEASGALAMLSKSPPQVICLDLLMPGRLGSSLYLAIHQDPRLAQIPVLIISGLDAMDEFEKILAREPDLPPPSGYVEKPIDSADFVQAVRALVESRSRGGGP